MAEDCRKAGTERAVTPVPTWCRCRSCQAGGSGSARPGSPAPSLRPQTGETDPTVSALPGTSPSQSPSQSALPPLPAGKRLQEAQAGSGALGLGRPLLAVIVIPHPAGAAWGSERIQAPGSGWQSLGGHSWCGEEASGGRGRSRWWALFGQGPSQAQAPPGPPSRRRSPEAFGFFY